MPEKVEEFQHFNSYKQARKTLKQLFRIAKVEHVTFTGGEPFLAERFSELVLFVRMKKKSVSIITNGNAGKEADYKQMKELAVTLLELPIHSPNSKIHDYMTNIPGSWEKSVESIKSLKELGMQTVVVVVITKANYLQIGETLEFIKSLGINRIMLNRFNIGGQGISEKSNLYLNTGELNKAFQIASEIGEKNKLILSYNVCTPLCVVNPKKYKNISFSTCSADVSRRPLTLDIYGNLRFCNHSPTILGNIFKDNITEMLNSEKAQLWNNTVPVFCSNCNLYPVCMAGCRAAAEQLNLSLNSPDPIVIDN